MKKWSLVVVLLYGLIFVALTFPLTIACFFGNIDMKEMMLGYVTS